MENNYNSSYPNLGVVFKNFRLGFVKSMFEKNPNPATFNTFIDSLNTWMGKLFG